MEFWQQEKILSSSPCSKLSTIDDLVSAPNTEVDGNLEWLSVLVEDCLFSTGHRLPSLPTTSITATQKPSSKTLEEGNFQDLPQENPKPLQDSASKPCRSRGKRKRAKITRNPLASWSYQLNPDGFLAISIDPPLLHQKHWLADSELIVPNAGSDPKNPKSEEEGQYWKNKMIVVDQEEESGGGSGELFVAMTRKDLNTPSSTEQLGCYEAAAEGQHWKKKMIVVDPKENTGGNGGGSGELMVGTSGKDQDTLRNTGERGYEEEEAEGQDWKKKMTVSDQEEEDGNGGELMVGGLWREDQNTLKNTGERGHEDWEKAGVGRRCSHCLAHRTPQWRAGPKGPKTLCNACGVRYKSGRLLPEYRPAKSPTFVSYLHSNSHKKVMEMRTTLLS